MMRIVLFAFVAARVQFDPGGPGFVTTLAYRAPDPAQPQLDVIQLCPSSSGSGLSTLPSSAGMLISPVSALLRWDFVCNFRAIERYKLGARKGPLYGYACVRCWYTKGLHAAIDGLLIDVVRPSVPVFRMSHLFPGSVPGMSRIKTYICPSYMNMAIPHLFVIANGRFN